MLLHAVDVAADVEPQKLAPIDQILMCLLCRDSIHSFAMRWILSLEQVKGIEQSRYDPSYSTSVEMRQQSFQALHAPSSASNVGSFAGKEKATWWQEEHQLDTITALAYFGTSELPSADTMAAIKKLIWQLYLSNTDIDHYWHKYYVIVAFPKEAGSVKETFTNRSCPTASRNESNYLKQCSEITTLCLITISYHHQGTLAGS